MSKKISFIKSFNKLLLSVNSGIESFFNSIEILVKSKKKTKNNLKNIDKKVLISIASVFILLLSFFLIPAFYDKDLVKIKLTNQISKKYNLEVRFNGAIKFGLFPKPHYFIKDTDIIYDEENLAKTDFTKVYISINNFFLFDNLKIKKLNFKKTVFNINSKNFGFFKNILNKNKSEHNIEFKESNLFYKDQNKDVIFLANINNLNFLYNDKFEYELNSSLDIFNIPFKVKIVNNRDKNYSIINIDSNKLRMSIQNDFDYSKEKIIGLLNLNIIKKLKKVRYTLNKKTLTFNTEENILKGKLDFKPFFLSSDLRFYQLDVSKLLKDNSIFLDLINSGILNNQNLNAAINVYFDKIKNTNYLKNISLKTYFEEGNIIIKNSSLNWKDSVMINFDDVQMISENNKISFSGTVGLDFNDIDEFYKQFQVKKTHRKKIKQMRLDFLFNLYENETQFDNLKVDGIPSKDLDSFLNDFNSKKINVFNKVLFKNLVKTFFSKLHEG